MKVIVDSSVWIDFFNGKNTPAVQKFKTLIKQDIQIFITGIILQEVLQGFKDDREFSIALEHLTGFAILSVEEKELAIEAAQIFRTLRRKGKTILSSNDFIIAVIAQKHDCVILTSDKHFKTIVQDMGIRLL